MKSYKQSLEEQYKLLFSLYGIGSRIWDDMYRSFSAYTFCDANKKSIIAMYLELEEFTLQAKAYDVVYYCGIDDFLESYHNAVYNCCVCCAPRSICYCALSPWNVYCG